MADADFRATKGGVDLNTGKTLFAQLMDFLPWTTFARYVARYDGDKGVDVFVAGHKLRPFIGMQIA